ncbi:alpha/beta hydrolase [Solimonas sp. K1W22B-7]|uniref:alpha/beta fold hydrolase n=1 Tax=Solimonas sp. K1W22B-7 TaxID=2303331 RepID=UPI000E32DB1A|nr:alpha/beta hydrolase [Solimonas sp. K1W22B-7]AXQ29251.1 alpha/beta hydrolase [Solimonas sp. K1W22B-7]
MQMISVNGAELSSMELGRDKGSAVVMLHGLVSGNMASWYSAVATPLSGARRVVLYDQRGHGGSSIPGSGFDLDSQVADLQAVISHHGLSGQPVDLVGHSMGALVALRFALRHPQQLRRLVLVDAPMPARDYVAPSLLGVTSPAALAEYVEVQLGGLGGRRRERLHQRLSALFFDSTLMSDVLEMASESDTELAALHRPVLLVYGRRSPCLAAGQHLQSVLPQAQLELLDCGHYIIEESPAALRALVDRFLSPEAAALDIAA